MTADTPILVLVPGFPSDESDLSCLPAVQNYMEALGSRLPAGAVELIAFQYPYNPCSYQWRGVRVHAVGGGNARLAKPRTWIRAVRTGLRFIAKRKRGVIHSFWLGECALVGSLLAGRSGWKHVVTIGGQEMLRQNMYAALLRYALPFLTAGSSHAASAAQRRLHRKVDAVIPLGLDVDRLRSLTRDRAADADRPNDLLAVGSLTRVKRFEDVVEVAALLIDQHPGLTVEIIGDGPERLHLLRRMSEAGVSNHIILRDKLPREEVLRRMQMSKVLLHPSQYESQGYVLLEALASGMFVVCRPVGFHPDSRNVDHATTVDRMAQAVHRRLNLSHSPEPVRVPTAEDTVDAFLKVYEA